MKKICSFALALPFAAAAFIDAPAAVAGEATDWVIDPVHSSAQFSVRHMMVSSVRGTFEKMAGTAVIDDQDPTKSRLDVTIETASIDTRDAKRDTHLRSAEFFDVEKHPTMTFKSSKVQRAGKGKLKVTGDLTMRGVTKPVTLLVEGPTPAIKNPWGVPVRGVSATTKINRKDWGLVWNTALETGGVAVGDEVQVQLDVELNPKPPVTAEKPADK